MSGVTGNRPITSRADFDAIVTSYKKDLRRLTGITNVEISGSYNSDLAKTSFGDIDLVILVKGDKRKTKKMLIEKLESIQSPFESEKYKGKMYYNSGEIITISYKAKGYQPVQIDNIIASSQTESTFKKRFLDLPAEKQGLLLGVIKTAKTMETSDKDTEYQYNLSSNQLQLRKVIYHINTKKEKSRSIVKTWTDWNTVMSLTDIDFDNSFEDIVTSLKGHSQRNRARIKGLFKSMVTVKSGEMNKPKGARKMYALDLVSHL